MYVVECSVEQNQAEVVGVIQKSPNFRPVVVLIDGGMTCGKKLLILCLCLQGVEVLPPPQ